MGTITRNFANNILGSGQLDATDGVSGNVPTPNVNNESLDNITALPPAVGFGVKTVSSDPPSLNEGEIFFNSTTGTFKSLINTEAWASASPLIEGRTVAQGSAGTATAGLVCFGNPASAPYTNNATEEYNGSGWSAGGDTTHAASNATAAGTQTAAIAMGISDSPTTVTIKYDGTSWTNSGHAFPGTGGGGVGSGTQTATLYSGQGSGTNSFEYNGSSWTAGGTMNTSRAGEGTGWGPQTSALMCTGRASSTALTSATEEYNGTAWTSTNNVNAARRRISGSKNSPSQDSGIIFGGSPTSSPNAGATVNTEKYDGTSWTEINNLSTGRNHAGGAGTGAAAWVAGSNPNSSATEEFTSSTTTITAGAFASGGNMGTAKQDGAGFGIQTAAIGAGGYVSGYTNNAQSYDGSSWTAIPNINTTRSCRGLGTQTSGLICAGNTPGDNPTTATESWNGSSWTSVNSMNTSRASVFSMGTFTSGLIAGGSPTSATETWDGTNWTSNPSNINTTRRGGMSAGTQSAGLICAGDPLGGSPNPETSNAAEEWDGSSWTSVSNSITERNGARGFGLQTLAVVTTGANQNGTVQYATSEVYNGTSWATNPNLANGRQNTQPAGVGSPIASSGLIFGGFVPGYFTSTEEFTAETSGQIAKTIQSS